MKKKPTLKERARHHCSRTCPVLAGVTPYIQAWAERCWIAGYRAGKMAGAARKK